VISPLARFLLLVLAAGGDALRAVPRNSPSMNRRAAACALVSGILLPAQAKAAESSVFVGKYTDPNNHPGGTREIMLLPGQVGAYRLANVKGGGGRGEPDLYNLPAIIIERAERQQIIVDFSVPPKNGPRDFAGQWEAGSATSPAGIRFTRDNNLWPKQQ